MTTATRSLKTSDKIPWINRRTFNAILRHLEKLPIVSGTDPTRVRKKETMHVLANYACLIYDKVELNNSWDVDYAQVKRFAEKNRHIIRYVLSKHFKMDLMKFEKWLHVDADLIECAMHRSSNRYNKHQFK